jgi:transcriptional regulator with XRE-family HTH domain
MPTASGRRRADAWVATRIRTLRMARGLTQHQLGGDDFTKGFISQLERGHCRLSLHAARVLAARLDVAVGDLLTETGTRDRQHELMLLQAEREFAAGSPESALRLAEGLRVSGTYRGRALRLRGRALLALDSARLALEVLEEAATDFRGRGNLDLAARTLYDIAIAHARLDETEEALLTALECERALRAGEVVDRTLELQVRALLASTYVRRGDFEAADNQTERALVLAQDVTNREAQAALYAGLAKSEQDRGNLERAAGYWSRSLTELEHLGREHAIAESCNSLALVYLARGLRPQADRMLARAETMATALGHPRLQAWLVITRSKAALSDKRYAQAQQLAESVTGNSNAAPRARAEAFVIVARAVKARGAKPELVRWAFERAIEAARDQPPGTRARILRQCADALESSGDAVGALRRMREAFDLIRPGID